MLLGEFDIVFSAWVTAWIGDLELWSGSAYKALKPRGRFLLNGGHPLSAYVKAIEDGDTHKDSYFDNGPFTFGQDPSEETTIEWGPTLGSMVTAAAKVGFHIDALLELPENEITRSDWPMGYGVKGRPSHFILAATKESR